MKYQSKTIVLDRFLDQCAIEISTLKRLVVRPARENIASSLEPRFKKRYSWCILVVSKHEGEIHLIVMMYIKMDKRIRKRLIYRHENDSFVFRYELLDFA